jgi:hypothetical protein
MVAVVDFKIFHMIVVISEVLICAGKELFPTFIS